MKRALFDTVTVLPFASGNVVDRTGYESAVLAVTVEASQTATIKVETADSTAGPYEPVKDSRIFVDNPVNEDGEAVIENEAEAQAVANLDIDLIGCKSCVKITATNGTIGALALVMPPTARSRKVSDGGLHDGENVQTAQVRPAPC